MSKAFNEELGAVEANAVAYLTAFNRADFAIGPQPAADFLFH